MVKNAYVKWRYIYFQTDMPETLIDVSLLLEGLTALHGQHGARNGNSYLVLGPSSGVGGNTG